MLLSIPGVQYAKRVALMLSMLLLMVTFGVTEASAGEEEAAVSVSPGETSCYYMQRRVTNPTEQWVAAMKYEFRNDVREDYPEVVLIPPRGEHDFRTDEKHYFQHSLGVKTIALSAGPGSLPIGEWKDWGAVEYVFPADCPPMEAAPKIWKRTAKVTSYQRPTIWTDVNAYRSDIGYRVGKQKEVRWINTGLDAGPKALHGPVLKAGKKTSVRIYVRYVDDSGDTRGPDVVARLRIKRRH